MSRSTVPTSVPGTTLSLSPATAHAETVVLSGLEAAVLERLAWFVAGYFIDLAPDRAFTAALLAGDLHWRLLGQPPRLDPDDLERAMAMHDHAVGTDPDGDGPATIIILEGGRPVTDGEPVTVTQLVAAAEGGGDLNVAEYLRSPESHRLTKLIEDFGREGGAS